MLPLPSPDARAVSARCRGGSRRAWRWRRPGSRAARTAIALALAAAASACTETHVVLEPVHDGGAGLAVSAISTGNGHTCAITTTQALYCWGKNDHGQLGVGDVTNHSVPTHVGPKDDWQAVATGDTSTLALKGDGTIWAFGDNGDGQLGREDASEQTTPVQVGDRTDWKVIAIRFQHACAIPIDTSLWCWGSNAEGQLGQGESEVRSKIATPVQVTTDRLATTDHFATVDVGQGHTCATKTDGSLWCWGRNSDAELGQESGTLTMRFYSPVQVGMATNWTAVQSGQSTTCGVRGGAAYCWGASPGEPGDPVGGIPGATSGTKVLMPTRINGPHVVTKLSFNTFGGAVIDDSGRTWLWGRNIEGELGLGNMDAHTDVVPAEGSGWTQVSVGRFTTCGVRGGDPVCTGKNDFGQLGRGTPSESPNFLVVTLPSQ